MSAKTDDLINKMFMKVVADVLKIKLTSSDLHRVATVVIADILPRERSGKTKQPSEKKTKSSFCVIQ